MQICFISRKKNRSTSKEDANLFYLEEKFRSTSKDVALFYFEDRVVHMQIIYIQERDYNNCIKTIML